MIVPDIAGEDEALPVRRNARGLQLSINIQYKKLITLLFFVLDFDLDVIDGVGRFNNFQSEKPKEGSTPSECYNQKGFSCLLTNMRHC